jgi:hypothetical protein
LRWLVVQFHRLRGQQLGSSTGSMPNAACITMRTERQKHLSLHLPSPCSARPLTTSHASAAFSVLSSVGFHCCHPLCSVTLPHLKQASHKIPGWSCRRFILPGMVSRKVIVNVAPLQPKLPEHIGSSSMFVPPSCLFESCRLWLLAVASCGSGCVGYRVFAPVQTSLGMFCLGRCVVGWVVAGVFGCVGWMASVWTPQVSTPSQLALARR